MTSLPTPRPEIRDLPTYSSARTNGVRWKASSNEAVTPPPASVLEAIYHAGSNAHLYPDVAGRDLVEALAEFLGVSSERIAVGAGSLSVLEHLLLAYVDSGDEVVLAWRSYEAYPILVKLAGGTPVTVPLSVELEHDLPAMLEAITDRTKVILVCNPNNPTGTEVDEAAIRRFLDAVPSHVIVVLDEAYREFARNDVDGVAFLNDYPNLVVLRTFSKAYGLAGLRVGYAVSGRDIRSSLAAALPPFAVSSIAAAAAQAAVRETRELAHTVQSTIRERRSVENAFTARGLRIPDSGANFVWLPLGADSVGFSEFCLTRGLSIRAFADEGVRFTLGDREASQALISAYDEYKKD
ncbi:histidinol-phosphate aminotransferase [Leifsonia sp. EB41]|uniref:histidinol-phosphate transaminase n=1 Tax=Leifsonia sp. EB41 TaxID=3156260 RepID=UPI003510FC15